MEQMAAYPVLTGKIAERGIRKAVIANRLGISTRALNNKLNGEAPFTWPEVVILQSTFFPDMGKEELMVRRFD